MNKYGILIFALVIAVTSAGTIKSITDDERTAVKKAHDKCQADSATHIDDDVLKQAKDGVHSDDPKLKVHLLCMSKATKFQKENGDLNVDYIKTKFAEHYDGEELTKLNACLVQKDTPEETAHSLASCQRKIIGDIPHHHHHHD